MAQECKIELENYSTIYKEDLEPVLKEINVTVQHGEKVGIVGRTGACKSSSTLALFRIQESLKGKLVIDNVDISQIGLVDLDTDKVVQALIRKEFANCTVLTIAHRIATVMDHDKIVVLDFGKVVEFDSPSALLKNPNSIFYSLASSSGLIE
jgi:ABC-type multidrug transport system fused ATPase/permease subunit